MKRNNTNWILIVLLVLIIILIVPRGLSSGRGVPMHSDYGMMSPGMMGHGMIGFGWIIPLILVVLVITAGVWLGNLLSHRSYQYSAHRNDLCKKCSEPVEANWNTCPYCSEPLK